MVFRIGLVISLLMTLAAPVRAELSGWIGDGEPELCFGRAPTITGTGKADVLVGTEETDVIAGGNGKDYIEGGGGRDFICGGGGDDEIHGGLGGDKIEGNGGDDLLFGDGGTDRLKGGRGHDVLDGGKKGDVVNGQGGVDACDGEEVKKCETDSLLFASTVYPIFDTRQDAVNPFTLEEAVLRCTDCHTPLHPRIDFTGDPVEVCLDLVDRGYVELPTPRLLDVPAPAGEVHGADLEFAAMSPGGELGSLVMGWIAAGSPC